MSAASLIAMGVEVMADVEGDDPSVRRFAMLGDLIREEREEDTGLREVVRMLRDAADSAIDAHKNDKWLEVETMSRMSRFSGFLSQALQEIR